MGADFDRGRVLEILTNLIFLTREAARDPERVIQYMTMAEEQVALLVRKEFAQNDRDS